MSPISPKQAGAQAGLPRPVEDHAISQNFHQLIAQIDRLETERVNSAVPRFLWIDQVIQPDGTVDVSLRVDDPDNRAGTLRAWTLKDSYDAPDPTSAVDGTASVPTTPATILPGQVFTLTAGGTGTLLQGIKVPAASGKRIYLEFVNDDGLSTGVQDFVLVGGPGPITPGGEIGPGTITARDQFIASVQPIEIVNALPATCTAGQIVVLATDGKLYRCTGNAWVPVVRAPDLSGVLTAEQLQNEIISTAKFAQGIRPVRIVSALPAAGEVTGDVVYNTADLLMYRWTGTAWTTAVKSADLSGLVQGGQLVDAAISAAKLADAAVINAKLGGTAVTSDKIASATIVGGNIAGGTITSSLVQTRTLAADRIASNVLTTGEIAAGAVHGDRITGTTVDAGKMVANTLTAGQIAAGAIATDELATNAVIANRIAGNQIYATHVVAGEITGTHIAAYSIDVGHIVATGITAAWIAADAITAAKIQAGAVGATHITVGSLAAIKADLGNVTAGMIGDVNGLIRFGSSAYGIPAGTKFWIDFLPSGAPGGTGVFINHSSLKLYEDGTAEFGGKVTATEFHGSMVDLIAGGGIRLRPAVGSLLGYIEWVDSGGNAMGSMGVGMSGGDVMALSTNGSTRHVSIRPNTVETAYFAAYAGYPPANASSLYLYIGGIGWKNVTRDANGYLQAL